MVCQRDDQDSPLVGADDFGVVGDGADVGPLARAQQLEQLAFLNLALNATANGSWTSGWKLVGAPTKAPVAA